MKVPAAFPKAGPPKEESFILSCCRQAVIKQTLIDILSINGKPTLLMSKSMPQCPQDCSNEMTLQDLEELFPADAQEIREVN
mmetsp:Transcript_508/g.559  ORF Transcript_508/g.559 Transcript_508/m.559 type:complete len:82 (-) Transcript_508:158-403(-)|eukprot:CAMPEP_0170557938 /NCGR_PEP_ID=MMETSP0211-20121228/31439_1 /TAXON_ID=311385 /ORGANISM="Pseudokeronopsis sp., Strain OXSARD2" /LENGTH=81 /DNA_ID=CAMNT_0010869411 /DNA_START=918 /DNA_END=1163 /DNA_ORIENTATION=-